MDILLVNHYAGSLRHGMEYRPFYLAREWVRLGHKVSIVAASQSHVRTVAPRLEGDVTTEEIQGVRYIWLRTPGYRGNGARRALNMFAFTAQLRRHRQALAHLCRNGAAIASSTYPFDVWPVSGIARAARARFIFEVHDLWPLSPIELGGMSPRNPFIRLLQTAENYAYRNADAVVSILPAAEGHMRSHGLAPGKFFHVPNGIDSSEWSNVRLGLPPAHVSALAALRDKGHAIALYAGAHGVANALDVLLHAAAAIRERPVSFVLVGQGPEKPALQKLAAELRLPNVLFLPPVEKSAMPALLGVADVLVVGLKRCPLFRFGISPNKLIDYMMAGKPIIQAIDAGNDMVSESRCGMSVPAEEPAAMAEAVLGLTALSPSDRNEMGKRAREYVLAHHEYRGLARRFLEILND